MGSFQVELDKKKKEVVVTGIEPMTFGLLDQRSTNWAKRPLVIEKVWATKKIWHNNSETRFRFSFHFIWFDFRTTLSLQAKANGLKWSKKKMTFRLDALI